MKPTKKKSSRLLALLLSFMLIFTMMPTAAFADGTSDVSQLLQSEELPPAEETQPPAEETPAPVEDTGLREITVNVAPSTIDVIFFAGENGDTPLTAEQVTDNGVVNNYHQYILKVEDGMYSYRGVDNLGTEDTGDDQDLGGMAFQSPIDEEIMEDGSASGEGQTLNLRRTNFYTTNANITAVGDYSLTLMPGSFPQAVNGTQYLGTIGSNATERVITPVLLSARGNALVYNGTIALKAELAETYAVDNIVNYTISAGTSTSNNTFSLTALQTYTITAPADAKVQAFNQVNNFNVTELAKYSETVNEDGTVTHTFRGTGSNNTYRVTAPGKITRAGYFGRAAEDVVITYEENENPSTTEHALDNANIQKRMEASTMVNVNGQNDLKLAVGDTFRLRAYRGAWQIINTDTANIMIEPDFNYTVISGGEHIEMTPAANRCTGNAGSGDSSNWKDIRGVSEGTAIIEVSYDAIQIGGNGTSNDGMYGATDPNRTSLVVIQVGGADTALSMTAVGAANTWDTEYDTVYFLGETGQLKFQASLGGEAPDTVEVSNDDGFTWTAVENTEGIYTASGLTAGNNLLKFTKGDVTAYQVVRAAQVTYTLVNTSRDGDDIIEGDTVKITFQGLYTPVSKFSGIYNPGFGQGHKVTYTVPEGVTAVASGGQYDFISTNSYSLTLNVTEPVTLTGGHIAFNVMGVDDPLGGHRILTDAGVGTNFSAVSTQHTRSVLPELTLNVMAMPITPVTVDVSEKDAAVSITDETGTELIPEDGKYNLPYGTFNYVISKEGYITERGTFNVSNKDGGSKTVSITLRKVEGAVWDGSSVTRPAADENGVYQIGTGAELAWFATNAGGTEYDAVLTDDISLGGFNWTPIANSSAWKGTFDGQGHYVTDLYINSTANNVALFGYVGTNAVIKNLGVSGEVTTTGKYAAGIATAKTTSIVFTIENCRSDVNVTAEITAAGIIANQGTAQIVKNCYNTGRITVTKASSSSLTAGGVSCPSSPSQKVVIKNSYNTGRISGVGKHGSVVYLSSASYAGNVENSYGLVGTCGTNTIAGTDVTAAELKALASTLGDAYLNNPTEGYNNGYPILKWEESRVLPVAKAELSAAMETYKDASNYRDAQKEELQAAIDAAKSAISQAETLQAAESAAAEAKAAMDTIKTKLHYAKEDALKEIREYKDPADYRDAEKSLLNSEIIRAEASIELCETEKEVAEAVATAKSRMDAIKTDAQLKEENNQQAGSSASVTVYFSVSEDEEYYTCSKTGEVMALKEVTVPYFDLKNYGMEQYYFASEDYTAGTQGGGTAATAKGKVTAMHLILYATEVYYCGVNPEDAGKGYLKDKGLLGGSTLAYTGGSGSSYMTNFWDMDENLNYYLNYDYPLASPGWGSTSDQIVLRDGDLLTVGHFSDWNFYLDPESVFNYIKAGYSTVETSAKQGDKVDLTVYRAGAGKNYATDHRTVKGIDVYYTEMSKLVNGDVSRWTKIGTTDAQGKITVDTKDFAAGQYMFAVEGQYGAEYKDVIVSAPGAIILNLTANPNAAPQEVTEVTTSKDAGTTTTPTEVTVTGSTATATITKENVTETIKQATENKSAEIVVQVTESDTKGASNVKVQLDTTTVKDVVNKTEAALTVKTENATVTLDRETLKTVAAEAAGSTVTLEVIEVAKPTEAHKEAAGENGHVIQLVIKSGNKTISLFNEGKATVTVEIPGKLDGKKVAAIHIGDDGKIEHLKGQEVTVGGKKHYRFDTPHFSTFALVDADEIGLEVEEQMTADEVKALLADLTPVARSVKTEKKNVKVTLKLDQNDKAIIEELEAEGFTVKYNFYRSTKKSSKYKSRLIKDTTTYTQTGGKKGTKYYYKARVQVYDAEGKLIARTALKDCRYANRKWTK